MPLYPATDGQQTGNNFVADTRNMLTAGNMLSWCKRGFKKTTHSLTFISPTNDALAKLVYTNK